MSNKKIKGTQMNADFKDYKYKDLTEQISWIRMNTDLVDFGFRNGNLGFYSKELYNFNSSIPECLNFFMYLCLSVKICVLTNLR